MATVSLDISRWQMNARVDLAAQVFSDEDLVMMRVVIYQREYKGSLAPGLPPIPSEIIAERTDTVIRVGCGVIGKSEVDAWGNALMVVANFVLSHPRMLDWNGPSVRRIEIRLETTPRRR